MLAPTYCPGAARCGSTKVQTVNIVCRISRMGNAHSPAIQLGNQVGCSALPTRYIHSTIKRNTPYCCTGCFFVLASTYCPGAARCGSTKVQTVNIVCCISRMGNAHSPAIQLGNQVGCSALPTRYIHSTIKRNNPYCCTGCFFVLASTYRPGPLPAKYCRHE